MIAVDSSTIIAFFEGESGNDVDIFENGLNSQIIAIPPIVLTEILSEPKLPNIIIENLINIPTLELNSGFWERAGITRSIILNKGLKCRLADALIAQSCIDYEVPIITRNKDFRHFEKYTHLKVIW